MGSLGNAFAQARRSRGLTVRDVSFRIRIPEETIDDLEHDRYQQFDSLLYLRWFIQRYSEFLGLSCSDCLRRLQEAIDRDRSEVEYLATGHRTLPDTRRPEKKSAPGGGMPVLLAPVLCCLLAFVGFSLYPLAKKHVARVAGEQGDYAAPASAPEPAPLPTPAFTTLPAPGIPTASQARQLFLLPQEQTIRAEAAPGRPETPELAP